MRLLVSTLAIILSVSAFTTLPVRADAPAAKTDGTLEVRAVETFNKKDYTAALPMLKALAATLRDNPDRLGMVQEQIRVCEKNIANPTAAPAAAPATQPVADATAAPAATTSDRVPHPAPKKGEVLDMTIKELGNFEFDDEKPVIPDDVKALSGSTIKLHGFMVPLDQAENISRFALVPSLFNCCYGQPPQVQHTIIVTCPKGKAVQYCGDEIVVEGKLTVDLIKDDGFITGIFAVETTSVKPAAK
jgi:hypothetical protein